ncbi:sensor domain-containing diguanylate cyclase [Pseudomarimonas salicorniae]|uniref:diguanylate cyclase n=1 Tax=Pseudomarimonas salicorniae TaxID=2933270 RepID=A0ABT0GLJ7_9GAMM|nr:sensor domain-containing diguanylate cyclase [Lysobacter sp. CAU 1642]MCK7594900.1 sensor domain-containing diguanylate cyclase [Lysobacter sp. CAU 1642]
MSAQPTASPRRAVLLGLLAALLLVLLAQRGLGLWSQWQAEGARDAAQTIEHALWLRGEVHALAAAESAWIAQGRGDGLARAERHRSATDAALAGLARHALSDSARNNVRQLEALIGELRGEVERLQSQRRATGPVFGDRGLAEAGIGGLQDRADTLVSALHAEALGQLESIESSSALRSMLGWLLLLLALPLLGLQISLLYFEARARQRAEDEQRRLTAQAEREQKVAQRHAGDLDRLGELGDQLRPTRNIEEIGEVLKSSMQHVLSQFHGALYLQAPSRNVIRRQVAWGKPEVPLEDMFTVEDCWAIRRGIPYPNDPQAPPCRHLTEGSDPRHVLCVPLMNQGDAIGVLHLSGDVAPGRRERRIAQGIADLLALSISQLRLQESLRVQSVRDPTTGLFNRRYIDASLLRECLRARRGQQTLALLLIDLDDFKRFNERHSHEAGDAALGQIGQLIQQTIRPEDIAGRHGGEEFLVLMPEVDLATALDRAELLRRALHSAPIDLHGRRVEAVHCSIGIALYPLHGNEPGVCLRAAEKAVQQAKEQGRDRVVSAPVPASEPAGQGTG